MTNADEWRDICPLPHRFNFEIIAPVFSTTLHRSQIFGQPTRGKTARNRLRRVDNFVLMHDSHLLRRKSGAYRDAMFVDLGFGAEPFTTLESSERLRSTNPDLRVLGVEIDPERVTAAKPYADRRTDFRVGGFNLPLYAGESVRAIRAFNVLRQYDEAEVRESHNLMGSYLLPGGLLIEGTSDPYGRVWTANLLRRPENTHTDLSLSHEALVFSTNFRWGFEPGIFQPVLPKNYIHRMIPGEPIYEFLEAWKYAARLTMPYKDFGLRQWFTASAYALADQGYSIDLRRRLLRKGYLIWKLNDGIHLPESAV